LRVNFGTPEFLAPEVVNYEFVSFPTDMWSVGVIAYMLLSGLSPFLGDDDSETLNNILSCSWDFEDEEFRGVSDQAKDFISKLLIKEKWYTIP
ncbi:Myosin light chain kinase family member 4, partial [Cariama cristata]